MIPKNPTQGRIQDFFRRGSTRLLLYFNTNKPDSFFFCRIPVALENRRSSQVVIPFEFKCMNVRNILAALHEV